eukprot:CAMPEP_0117660210 /NCGR_PEP_ID=MMETSP0804-20121206/6847_1 /TAXON_ID=1074897 /ORGANISM="Tetraselmis astigmatica, Strain CCMP880" /LENGTH=1063 /DNA_ID=CAMNT_0005466925 /DNA_START=281 /DNA_END=3472 /DNA_ORIENTATION=-
MGAVTSQLLMGDYGYNCVALNIGSMSLVAHANPEMVQQLVEETDNFGKEVHEFTRGPFWSARQSVGKALFTASDSEPEWGIAHRILISAFSMQGMKGVVPVAVEVTRNTIRQFEALSSSEPFEAGGFMTGITFDVIGKFSCHLDFGTSRDLTIRDTHPFLKAMDVGLSTNVILGKSPSRAKWDRSMMRSRREAIHNQRTYVHNIIDERRSGKQVVDSPDLLSRMLTVADPETGAMMTDELIVNNLITFFIAGHDSTSSLLTTAMYYISQNPAVEDRMVAEIMEVLGPDGREPEYADLKKLKYMTQVLKECLRLHPPAPAFVKQAKRDCLLGGYKVKAGMQVATALGALHMKPSIWGENPEVFDPDRFSSEAEATRHRYSWLPFSAGPRACIGMQLSLTEARVTLAMLFRSFTFRLHKTATVRGDSSKLFFKLRDVYMTAHPRASAAAVPRGLPAAIEQQQQPEAAATPEAVPTAVEAHGTPLGIFYGSNMGNCKGLAEQLAAAARLNGFTPTMATLDSATEWLQQPAEKPLLAVVVTSTYNGTPPDNARAFSKWAEALPEGSLAGKLRFGVLGVGNSNWKSFQAFPRKVVADMAAAGAEALSPHGEADEEDDFDGVVSEFSSRFWAAAVEAAGLPAGAVPSAAGPTAAPLSFQLSISEAPAGKLVFTDPAHEAARTGTVLRTYDIVAREAGEEVGAKPTRHVEVQLPRGVTYSHGDHLAVVPFNRFPTVLRVAQALGCDLTDVVVLNAAGGSGELGHLPYGSPVTVRLLLLRHVDLQAPLRPALIELVAAKATDPEEQAALQALTGAERSALNDLRLAQLLESFPSLAGRLSLEEVLPLLPPVKQRYYSISSSPDGPNGPRVATVTVGLVEGSSQADGSTYTGLASGLLHSLLPGMPVDVFVASNDRFRLPADPKAPVIMVGPGTGLAPFRGFLQQLAARPREAPAALFFGCRGEADFLYQSELRAAAMDGTLELLSVAFSRAGPEKVYVQHKLWENRAAVWDMLEAGGYVYVCGDARHMAKDVDCMLVKIVQEVGGHSHEAAVGYVQSLTDSNRYLQDVWAN